MLAELWDPSKNLSFLEVASGSGQHAAYFAERFTNWTFQPTDLELAHLESIEAYREDLSSENLLAPVGLDVGTSPWPVTAMYHGILAINLIHISPWSCTLALLAEGRSHLVEGGGLLLYGAFRRGGHHTAPSNEAFDEGLRWQNPEWGVRCLDEVAKCAEAQALFLETVIEMPANNLSVLFRRRPDR